MKKVAAEELQEHLPRYLRMVSREPIAVTRGGKVCAAIVALDDLEFEAYALARNPKCAALIERSRESARREGVVSLESLEKKLRLPRRRFGRSSPTSRRAPSKR